MIGWIDKRLMATRKAVIEVWYDLRWRFYKLRNRGRTIKAQYEIDRKYRGWSIIEVSDDAPVHGRIFVIASKPYFESGKVRYVRNVIEMRTEVKRWLIEHASRKTEVKIYSFADRMVLVFEDPNLAFEFKLYWL